MMEKSLTDFTLSLFPAQFHGHRCDVGPAQPAGNNATKIGEVGIHIQAKAVKSNTATYGYADGCDLSVVDPNTGVRGPANSVESKILQCADRAHLQVSQIAVHFLAQLRAQIDDGIYHHLAGTVVRHVSAAACPNDRDFLRSADVAPP